MILNENYTLSNGVKIPIIGLGTWLINKKSVVSAIKEAVALGYRHIDTAQAYQNEVGVGEGLSLCGKKRSEIFVTSKVAAEHKTYDAALKSIEKSMQDMGLDYIDLMIIHSPKPWQYFLEEERYYEGNREAWRALEDAYLKGWVKSIGLSNFEMEDVENILSSCTIKPMVNQILAHVSNTPFELIEYCKKHDILVEAYSPIGHGELLKNTELQDMASKYGVSVPQLSIRYTLQLGLLPLPKTANPQHMKNNADVDFEIQDEDMEILKNMEKIKDYGDSKRFPVYAK